MTLSWIQRCSALSHPQLCASFLYAERSVAVQTVTWKVRTQQLWFCKVMFNIQNHVSWHIKTWHVSIICHQKKTISPPIHGILSRDCFENSICWWRHWRRTDTGWERRQKGDTGNEGNRAIEWPGKIIFWTLAFLLCYWVLHIQVNSQLSLTIFYYALAGCWRDNSQMSYAQRLPIRAWHKREEIGIDKARETPGSYSVDPELLHRISTSLWLKAGQLCNSRYYWSMYYFHLYRNGQHL